MESSISDFSSAGNFQNETEESLLESESLVILEFFKSAMLLTSFHARTVEISIILISFSKPLKGGFFLVSF